LLDQTFVTQPALFCIEYALAQLWMSWGVIPAAMIGHSIGEYVAACLAGVFSLEDALGLVATRGQLMQSLPSGAMLAVMLSEKETRALLRNGLALAAVNGAKTCVVSGTSAAIQELHDHLKQKDVYSQLLHTSHAFHSEMMEPIREPFSERVRQVKLNAPLIPFLSNVTGAWITNAQTADATYWSSQLRQTVRFADVLGDLLTDSEKILLEVGPGQTLSALVKQHSAQLGNQVVISSLPRPREAHTEPEFLLTSVARFWLAGGQIDWDGFYANEQRCRVPLPTYPFERQRYYIEPDNSQTQTPRALRSDGRKADIADWFYLPSWRQFNLPRLTKTEKLRDDYRLIFCDESGVGDALIERLLARGERLVVVRAGEHLRRTGELTYSINPQRKADYDALVKELVALGLKFEQVIHLWSVTADERSFEKSQELGLYSLILLTQALSDQSLTDSLQFVVVTESVHEVTGAESLRPELSTILGACKVIPQEYPEITCRSIDVVVSATQDAVPTRLIEQLIDEITENVSDRVVAYRGRHRWVQSFEPVRVEKGMGAVTRLRESGVYLIVGGLGSVGLALAQHLGQTRKAKLALLGRSGLPPKEEWPRWLQQHDDADDVSDKIRKVQALEAVGAEVLLLRADVTNEEQMLAAIAGSVERFGRIDGVIYGAAAGASTDKDIRELTPADCMLQFQPKVNGLTVLEKVLQGAEHDFCLMLSSLSSVLGGMTYGAYAAANVYMDTFVRKHNQTHPETWLSVNWDGWDFEEDVQQRARLRATDNHHAIKPEEGFEAFERIVSMGPVTQVLVSTSDLSERLARWLTHSDLPETPAIKEIETRHPRPNLLEPYVAPSNELEDDLVNTWQELLGIEQVGINDNFFELGGHSLLATMVTSRLRKEFGVELSLRSFFESPTISGLALIIAQRVIEDQDEQSIAQLLEGVDILSRQKSA
jgi:acyl transferase domain-containing protein